MYKQTNVDKRINIYIYIYVKMNDKQQEQNFPSSSIIKDVDNKFHQLLKETIVHRRVIRTGMKNRWRGSNNNFRGRKTKALIVSKHDFFRKKKKKNATSYGKNQQMNGFNGINPGLEINSVKKSMY